MVPEDTGVVVELLAEDTEAKDKKKMKNEAVMRKTSLEAMSFGQNNKREKKKRDFEVLRLCIGYG